ncbi:hypothetical protein EJD97_006915 [Solanum chilense]|uniref:DUF1279 domain-containing protein n=1 Tax=Solanum chilense TaxID=4083 RepID=A0A6N2CDG9_SOLCI|nr:hypothetical protein EJD97_006915 [Solanum chilense]
MAGSFRELLKKYGKAALGVHFSVSAASITSLYVALKNNVDVEALFEKIGMPVVLLNRALFPLRVPITLCLTPPITRFLARRRIINNIL